MPVKFSSIQPFVPSGSDFEKSKQLFLELGFIIKWNAGDYIGFDKDGCNFILQKYDNREFAENFMITVNVSSIEELATELREKVIKEKFKVHIGNVTQQPYGKEIILIDIAGVCWHFVE